MPGWVWLFCGLCLGLIMAAGAYIFARPAGSPGPPIEIAGVPGTEKQAQDKPEEEQPGKPRFAFYEMLPNYEVVIPEEEYTGEGDSRSVTPKVETPGRYVIQAGSFSAYEDADRRQAELALLGVESEIKQVRLEGERTVYRVLSQPIQALETLNKTLKRLRENGIDTLVMRHKG